MRPSVNSLRFLVVALALMLGASNPGFAQPPAKVLTAEQKEKDEKRNAFWQQSLQFSREGKLPEAIAAADQVLAIELAVLGPEHQEIVVTLQHRASLYERAEDFPAAEKDRRAVLRLQTKQFGAKAWQVTDARLDLQHVETLARLDAKARQELKEADQWMSKAFDNNKPGKYQEGIEFAEKAFAIRVRLLGQDRESARSAILTGWLCHAAGQFKKARPHYEQALAIRKKVLGDNHPDTAQSSNNLGFLLTLQGDYAAARLYHEQALAIRKKALGDNHPDTAWSLNNLGYLLTQLGDYAAARPYHEQALAIRKKVLGDNHLDTATSLNHLGVLLTQQGDYAAARSYYEQALAIRKKALGDNHPDTAFSLNGLGVMLIQQGDYAAARSCHEQALSIRKKALGDNHPLTAASLNNLGVLLDQQGDYAAARRYFEQALAINKRVLGENHADTARSLDNLGASLSRQEDYAAARPCFEQALAIRKKALGDNHHDTAWSLNNLGYLLTQQGDFAAALPYLEQALAIRKKVLGDNHSDTAMSLNSLGILLFDQGDYSAARPCYEQALAIRKKVLGDNHPDTAQSLNNLGWLLSSQGDNAAARRYFEQALAISQRSLDLTAVAQSERQQLLMGTRLRYQVNNFLKLSCDTEAITVSTYAHVLVWKGSVLARQLRLRLERQNPQLAPLVAELRSTSSQLATLAFATPDPKKREVWNRQLEKLTTDKETLERELVQKSQSFRQDQELKNLTPSKLLELLPAETALVDFFVYRHSQPDPNMKGKWIIEDRLTAFVLKPGAAIVRLDLGPMASIEKVIDQWRDSYKKQSGKDHPGIELRRLLWLPLEKHLTGAKTVIISPDGALGRLPFAALPGSKVGSYLLEDVALTVVPVPRLLPALLGQKDEPSKAPSLLLVGDIDFDADAAGKADPGSRVAATGTRSGERTKWASLPGTRGEIVAIGGFFEKRFGDSKLKILRGEQATQGSLRELASKYSHLHLATHGFFAPPEVRSALAGDDKDRSAGDLFDKQGVTGFHPGLLTGLVFAGANKPPAPGESDGILTALEVAELDLTKVELAVLSACETGLGKVAAGEGILGLQRAFQVAGARTVVASMWSVPDEPTRVLMERFYENQWTRKMGKLEALRDAQLWMLREGRAHAGVQRGIQRLDLKDRPDPNGPLPPYYWAAFVLSGDWR